LFGGWGSAGGGPAGFVSFVGFVVAPAIVVVVAQANVADLHVTSSIFSSPSLGSSPPSLLQMSSLMSMQMSSLMISA
jgi:hypothetical protein